MSVITATESRGGLAGYVNPNVSSALRSFAADYWPPHSADASTASSAAVTRVNVATAPRAIAASDSRTYRDDFYYRVHLIPTSIDLGNLVTAQSRTIDVWNAWPDLALSMTDLVITGGDGITVTGDATRPLTFAPLQQRTWDVAVTVDGPPVIAAEVSWVFTGQPSVVLTITGNRLTAWLISPDWGNAGITERLIWLTDVQEAVDGTQDRVVDRQAPRRQWDFDAIAAGRERRLIESTLYDWRARNWALPVWPEMSLLTAPLGAGATAIALDTTSLDFTVGGLVMLWSDPFHYELVEAQAVQAASITLAHPTAQTWGIGTRVYPCRTARLAETPRITRKNSDQLVTSLRFEAVEPCDWPAVAPVATYLGVPVLEDRIDEGTDPQASFDRQLVITDNDTGLVAVDDITGLAWPTQSHAWVLWGRQERAAHRSLLYWLQGRANALWLPSWTDDLVLLTTVASNVASLTVEWAGVTRYLAQRPGRRHLRIELLNGTVLYRTVTASAELDADTEQLSIDTPPGIAIAPSAVRQISWMLLATLASDTVEITHVNTSEGEALCSTSFAGVVAEEA